MNGAQGIADHVADAAELVRQANHATHGGSVALNDAYTVVGHLDQLVHRLPQLLGYLVHCAERADPAGYYDDRGHAPTGAIDDASHALARVVRALELAGAHTTTAHNALSHLGQRLDQED